MTLEQGDLRLLDTDLATRLLTSTIPARYAYTSLDGTPRIVASWFVWTGEELVLPAFVSAPHVAHAAYRVRALGRTRTSRSRSTPSHRDAVDLRDPGLAADAQYLGRRARTPRPPAA